MRAVRLLKKSRSGLSGLSRTWMRSGSGYEGAMEVERLYYRIESDAFDQEVGLLRIPFGYSQAWKPSDFLALPNPPNSNDRARGVLGAVFFGEPADLVLLVKLRF